MNGTLKLAHNIDLSTSDLVLLNGVLSLENGRADDVVNINSFYSEASASLRLDADFAAGINDHFIAADASGDLKVSHLNILSDAEITSMTLFENEISPTLYNFNSYTNGYKYTFTPSATMGVFDVVRETFVLSALNLAVEDPSNYRSFSATGDTNVSYDLGNMAGDGSTLDIFGNHHNINGLGYLGVNVAQGQTLNISDVGGLNPDGSVNKSWNGFYAPNNGHDVFVGSSINNRGTLNISNSVFSQNQSEVNAGVIYNEGILNISDSSFIDNHATYGSGVIYHNRNYNSAALSISNSIFDSNSSVAEGGAITIEMQDDTNPMNVTNTITSSTFKNNFTEQDYGGALYIDINNIVGGSNINNKIESSSFVNNSSNQRAGGAIRHYSYSQTQDGTTNIELNITGSSFTNNYSFYEGGAINNTMATEGKGISNLSTKISDSTFTDNYSESDGGAINNSCASYANNSTMNTTISNSTFTSNNSQGNGGAINSYTDINNNNQNSFVIKDSSFTSNNSYNGYGGAVSNYVNMAEGSPSYTLNISNSSFDANSTQNGESGAVYSYLYNSANSNTYTVDVRDSTFSNNTSSHNSGAFFQEIYDCGNNSTVTMDFTNTKFQSNYADSNAGALSVYLMSTDGEFSNTEINFDHTEFNNNYASNGYGGGIYYTVQNTKNNSAIEASVNNSSFDSNFCFYHGGAISTDMYNAGENSYLTFNIDNSTFNNNSSGNGYGGAIFNYMQGFATSMTIKNSTFTNNSANNGYGGAIWTYGGTLNIIADGGNTLFEGNTDSTGANDISFNDSILNLNAASNNSITFNSGIVSAGIHNNLNINMTSNGAQDEPPLNTPTTGTINVNSPIINTTVNLFNGTLHLGHNSDLSTSDLNLYGGILNLENNRSDDFITINNLYSESLASLRFDANMNDGTSDALNVLNSASGTLNISHVNILADGLASNITLFANEIAPDLSSFNGYTNSFKYIFNPSETPGVLDITRQTLATSALNLAVEDSSAYRSFSATSDANIAYGLGNMAGTDSTLDIFGNKNNINGLGYSGINVLQGQTLNISGVGKLDSNGDVNKSWNGFYSANDGAAVNNLGTLNISNSVFSQNQSETNAGVIYNEGALTISNSTFYNNSSGFAGGVIVHNIVDPSNQLSISNSTFNSNTSGAEGGAIAIYQQNNTDSSNINNTINTSVFKNNTTEQDSGGAIYIDSGNFANNAIITNTINSTSFTNNKALEYSGGAIINSSFNIGENSTITTNINNSIFTSNSAQESGGAILNSSNNSGVNSSISLNITNSAFSSNEANVDGGAIYTSGEITTIKNSSFSNNIAQNGLGGAIYASNNSTLNIIADGNNTVFTGNTDSTGSNAIHLEQATMNLNAGNGGIIKFNDKISSADLANNININKTGSSDIGAPPESAPTSGLIYLNNSISGSTVNLYNGTLYLAKDNYLDGNNLSLYGGHINMANNNIGTMALNSLSLQGNTSMSIDADLINSTADRITSVNPITTNLGTERININRINLLNDATKANTSIQIADANTKDYITLGQTTAQSPIYNYNISYNSSGGNLDFGCSGFTPSIMASPVASSAGTYLTQVSMYQESLSRADSMMFMPQSERLLMKYNNKYASAGNDDQFVFSPTMLPESRAGIWFKQFTTFENVPLNNGPNVSNVVYGMLVGADSEIKELGNGFTGYVTAYAGYTGSHQNYNNVGSYQNGGIVGLTGTVYKGNFFASLTANTGASNGNNYNSYGTDNFTTITAGAAGKVGYNFEFLKGKLILQPTYTMSYTFADTLNYTTASGVDITSSPLNAIQIIPGIKLIGNLKNGWQPYLGVNMVWNIMDQTRFYANDVQLPQLSVAPYVEYGVGVQRKWGDRFTGFGQAMLRGGGRNGVALQFGLRYAIGK